MFDLGHHNSYLASREIMQYRISTVLLSLAIVAICLGWWADQTSPTRRDIVGSWLSPATGTLHNYGYTTALEIRDDGTFTKRQDYQMSSVGAIAEIYDGKYTVNDDGIVAFAVLERTYIEKVPGFVPAKFECNVRYDCRCGIDGTKHLVIKILNVDNGDPAFDADVDAPPIMIEWETYAPQNAR